MGLLDWLRRRSRRTDEPVPATGTAASPLRTSSLQPSFAVVDVETTGLSPKRDRILELAIVRVDARGTIVDEWVQRFDPEGPVGATHIHGITETDVVGMPLFSAVAPAVVSRIAGLPVIAHNAKFDLAFLRNELTGAGWSVPWMSSYCTLDASHTYLPDLDRRRLVDCCWAAGVHLTDAHSALGDARATAGLLRAYLVAHRGHDSVLREAKQSAAATVWPSHPSRPSLTPAQRRAAATQGRARPLRITPPRPAAPPLMRQLSSMSLLEVLEEGAPVGATAYLELLFDALEDGDISEGEADALQEARDVHELSTGDMAAAHEAFLLALAHRALDDGLVSRDERRELRDVAALLSVPESKIKAVLDRAEAARHARLSAALGPLPDPWLHGDPLRVGDKVVFTGCDEQHRERLERRAEELGVRVISAVSRLTVMLVTDGSFSGTKRARAEELGTRHVHPETFEVMLAHLQPAARPVLLQRPVETARTHVSEASADAVTASAPAPSVVRAWAIAAGLEVGVRGRLPKHVIEAYLEASQAS